MSLMTARVLVLNLVVDLLLWLQPTIGCTAQSVFQRASLLCGSQKKKKWFSESIFSIPLEGHNP